MTQDLFVVADQSGRSGKYVKRDQVIKDVQSILGGQLDNTPEELLLYIGDLSELKK